MARQARAAFAALPAGDSGRRTALLGGTALGVTTFSPRIELALDFMRTVYRPQVARQMAESALGLGLMWLPAGRQDQIAALPLPEDRKQAMLAQLQDAEGPPNCPGWMRLEYVLTRAVQRYNFAVYDHLTALARLEYAMGVGPGCLLEQSQATAPDAGPTLPAPRELPPGDGKAP